MPEGGSNRLTRAITSSPASSPSKLLFWLASSETLCNAWKGLAITLLTSQWRNRALPRWNSPLPWLCFSFHFSLQKDDGQEPQLLLSPRCLFMSTPPAHAFLFPSYTPEPLVYRARSITGVIQPSSILYSPHFGIFQIWHLSRSFHL